MPTNQAPQAEFQGRGCAWNPYTGNAWNAAAGGSHPIHDSCTSDLAGNQGGSRGVIREGPGLLQPCEHTRATHQHGTRAAYVRDRCRCSPCRGANAAATAAARRDRALGHQRLIDVTGVRTHLLAFRRAGLGVHRLAALSGISVSHIRALTAQTTDGQPAVSRVHPATAARILALSASRHNSSPNTQVSARGTVRRLQALHAIGWSTPELAHRLGRSTQSVRRTMAGQLVSRRTAEAVAALYGALWDLAPIGSGRDATATRADAGRRGWVTPMAWDDIDSDDHPAAPPSGHQDLDEIAIERALARDGMALHALNAAEQLVVVRTLTGRGLSISQIADALSTTSRTVSRRRAAIRRAS